MTTIFFDSVCGAGALCATAIPLANNDEIRSFRTDFCIFSSTFFYVEMRFVMPPSESETAHEKQHARIFRTRDGAEGRIRDGRIQVGKLRMIESVMCIGAEGKGRMFSKRHIPHEA